MEGRGRLAEPPRRSGQNPAGTGAPAVSARPRREKGLKSRRRLAKTPSRIAWIVRRWTGRITRLAAPRFVGLGGTALLILLSIGYGVVKGDHVKMIVEALKDARDSAANAAGFPIAAVSLSGENHVSRAE